MADDFHPGVNPREISSEEGTDRRAVRSVYEAKNTNPVPWRRLLLPTDHGSWAFILEPVLLGLLVAFSSSAVWLGLAVLLGFIARKPAKLTFGTNTPAPALRRQARVVFLILGLLSLIALGFAVSCASPVILLPLTVAAPGIWLFARQELEGQTRSLLAELVGTGICSLPLVAIAAAAGWSWRLAISLGLVNLARAWPTLLFVRAQLRSARGATGDNRIAVFAQMLAPSLLLLLAFSHQVPWPVVTINSVLSVRALLFLGGIFSAQSPKRIGIAEVVWGLAYVIGAAASYRGSSA